MADYQWGDELPTLSGRRLDLRWIRRVDAPALFGIFGDPEVIEYWSSPPLEDLAAARRLVDEIHESFGAGELFEWGVRRRDTDELIGTCTLCHLDMRHRRAELGFALGRRAWGQGFATEAVGILIDFAFESLGLHRIEADVDPNNERSLRLLERQGFRREGHLRERWHHLGGVHDGLFLGLLRREWSAPGPA